MAYYTQWKITEDRVPLPLPAFRSKNRYLGFGPEFNTVLPISEKTPVFATFRYLFETGNRVATQGNILFFSLTVAIPTKHQVGAEIYLTGDCWYRVLRRCREYIWDVES